MIMIDSYQPQINSADKKIEAIRGYLDIREKQERQHELESRLADPEVWQNPAKLREVQQEKSGLDEVLENWSGVLSLRDDVEVLLEMAKDEESGIEDELKETLSQLEGRLNAIEKAHVLSGKQDRSNAILEVHAGSGGLEAQDWASMLLRMYLRFAEKYGFSATILDILDDDAAGIKSATIEIAGDWAYGYLKAEVGVHRLVRISPFDAAKRRHTSFASIMVSPEVDENIDVNIDEKDLRIDTYRASGAGGQHVNRTESAIRITHIPTGVVVQCQNERSQHKNKAFAMKVLASKLYELEVQKKQDEMSEIQGAKKEITWGSQIRSYVLQPYQMVKDHRTNHESGNPDAVLDGELMAFIDAYLMQEASGGKPEE